MFGGDRVLRLDNFPRCVALAGRDSARSAGGGKTKDTLPVLRLLWMSFGPVEGHPFRLTKSST